MTDIEEYYKTHGKKVYYYILSLVHNKDLAEELTQETFFQAMQTINNYRGECKPSVWLCQIAKHVWYRYLEKNKKWNPIPLDQVCSNIPTDFDVVSQIINQENKLNFYKQLQKLDNPMREILYLRIESDLSFLEIGEIMNRSENWARVTFYRAKKKLMEGDFK